jgi:hypothetical protein
MAPGIRESVLTDALLAVSSFEHFGNRPPRSAVWRGLTRARALSRLILLFLGLGSVARAEEALWQLFEFNGRALMREES